MRSVFRKTFIPLFLLASCAEAMTAASEDEKSAAVGAHVRCLMTAARQLDDGTSSASSVALGLVSRCRPEFFHSIDVLMQGNTYAAKAMLIRRMEDTQTELQMATRAVLETRAAKK